VHNKRMKQFVIVPLYGFKREPSFVADVQIMPGAHLLRCCKMWASLTTDDFKHAIGRMEFEGIQNSEAAVWFFIPNEEPLPSPRHYLFERLGLVKLFLNMLWAVKDCSVNCKLGFLQWHSGDTTGYESNSLGRLYSKASGKVDDTIFSAQEVKRAQALMLDFAKTGGYERQQSTALIKGNSRLAIFLHHTEAARAAGDLALRIMHSCSGLESLLSTTTSELSHQLSERAALLTASIPEEQRQVFLEMKTVYDIRSKVAHGSTLKGRSLNELASISSKLDSLLRSIFSRVLEDSDLLELFSKGTDDEINSRFVSLLFRTR
jgi:hypothetical protein